jgi:hypothetical protein
MSIQGSGKKIRLKDLVCTTIPMAKSFTKDNGKMIFRKGKVESHGAMGPFLRVIT